MPYDDILSLGDEARLGLTISNLITYEIHKHLAFYWNSTLALIKQTAERDNGK